MATILKGAPVVAAMNERNAALCEQLKAKGITPTLAVVRVGEREDDLSYERGVMNRCGKVGVAVRQFVLPADATQEQLLQVLDEVNTDDGIHGCLLFRPLPKQFDDRTVRAALPHWRRNWCTAQAANAGCTTPRPRPFSLSGWRCCKGSINKEGLPSFTFCDSVVY